jgi:preprotein translocase YajC subunit
MLLNLLESNADTPQNSSGSIIIMIVLVIAIIGLFVWQTISGKKKQKEAQEMVNALKKGDKVKTIGGICGYVVEINDAENTFVLETGTDSKKSYVKFDKGAIYQTAPAQGNAVPVEELRSIYDENYIKAGIEFVDGKYNLSVVVTHHTSDWSVITLEKPVPYIWIKAVRRLDAVEIFYSYDDVNYIMMRNAWLQDNIPVKVGVMAASPDGNGFKATFEHFKVKHLPDQRRLEWLKKNAE